MDKDVMPHNRLRIFVSSAQQNEGSFEWENIRSRIVKKLRECPYLNPFIIEESGSELPSTQRFLFKVEQSDLVILLVKGDVREGTALEVSTAIVKKKPMLVYFLDDENPNFSVSKLKRDLQASDYCTYHKIHSIEYVEEQVFQDVAENLIDYYQYNHFVVAHQPESYDGSSLLNVEHLVINSPTKETFALFESAYNHVFDCLSLGYLKIKESTQESPMHSFGTSALDWLIKGTSWPEIKDVLDLSEKTASIFGKSNWYLRRWDAINNFLSGNYERALSDEEEALRIAKSSDAPEWIINDILIDCRNLTVVVGNKKHQITITSSAQEELNKSETIAFLPVADRYSCNMFKEMIEAEMDIELSSPFSIRFGSNLSYVIRDFVNYYFSAILYGSYTHIILARDVLASILYKYAEINNYPELLLRAINLYILSGNAKRLKQILDNRWEECYPGITSEADKYWSYTDFAVKEQQAQIKQAVFSKLGMYFSDSVFADASTFIQNRLPEIYWGNCEDYLQCILDNIIRINPDDIIEVLLDILKSKKYNLGRKISNILMQVNIREVPTKLLQSLHDVLLESLEDVIKQNGNPQFIAALEVQRADIFSDLSKVPDNGLVGDEKLYYELNMGGKDYECIYNNLIDMARNQFMKNNSGKSFSSFAVQPYASISSLMKNGDYFSSQNEERFFALCKEVLSSSAPIPVKDDCCDCLCDVLVTRHANGKSLPDELHSLLPSLDARLDNGFILDRNNTENTFLCRTLLLKLILGEANSDEIVKWSIMLGKVDANERVIISKCAEKYLHFLSVDAEEPNGIILSVVFQCVEDNYHVVRQFGCNCLCYLLNTKYHDHAEAKLYEMVLDSSHWVRNHLIRLCRSERITNNRICTQLLSALQKDANYGIRQFALSSETAFEE